MGINNKNILQHELIGLRTQVSNCKNRKDSEIKGRVIDETQKSLIIEDKGKEKRVFKQNNDFIFNLPDSKVKVRGSSLLGRPWERIKKNASK